MTEEEKKKFDDERRAFIEKIGILDEVSDGTYTQPLRELTEEEEREISEFLRKVRNKKKKGTE